MKKNNESTRTVKVIGGAFKREAAKAEKSAITLALLAVEYIDAGGKQKDLTEVYGVVKSTVSKSVALGKALALVGTEDESLVKAVKATLTGDAGDRAALVEAVKEGDASGVVAATLAEKPQGKGKGKGSKPQPVKVSDMGTEALLALFADIVETLATRDDMTGKNADTLAKHVKSAGIIAKNLAAMPVA